tara:strand:- start:2767 stop:3165 length:399 start_codon:yes stop_codon:yes gene_type:complete
MTTSTRTYTPEEQRILDVIASRDTRTQEPTKTHVPDTPVTKLPEVHDPAGESLPFHIPAGKATQVLGTREVDASRVPDNLNPLVTDSQGRALPTRSAMAREREALEVMKANEALTKLMRKWGAKRLSYSFSR